ncbi:MAG TPA: hypothetical protein VN306_18795, partial [Mycobacterium sp.]|nr:hypothetical protein [Mycobacterium sp.]
MAPMEVGLPSPISGFTSAVNEMMCESQRATNSIMDGLTKQHMVALPSMIDLMPMAALPESRAAKSAMGALMPGVGSHRNI